MNTRASRLLVWNYLFTGIKNDWSRNPIRDRRLITLSFDNTIRGNVVSIDTHDAYMMKVNPRGLDTDTSGPRCSNKDNFSSTNLLSSA